MVHSPAARTLRDQSDWLPKVRAIQMVSPASRAVTGVRYTFPERRPRWRSSAAIAKCRLPARATMTGLRALVIGPITVRTTTDGGTGTSPRGLLSSWMSWLVTVSDTSASFGRRVRIVGSDSGELAVWVGCLGEHVDRVANGIMESHRAGTPGLSGRRQDPGDAEPIDARVLRIDIGDLKVEDHPVGGQVGGGQAGSWVCGEPRLGEGDSSVSGRNLDVVGVKGGPSADHVGVERGQALDVIGHETGLYEAHVHARFHRGSLMLGGRRGGQIGFGVRVVDEPCRVDDQRERGECLGELTAAPAACQRRLPGVVLNPAAVRCGLAHHVQ